MSYGRWTWPVGVLLGVAGSVGVALWGNVPLSEGPLVQITTPPSGFKLRQGQTMPVRVRVQPGARPLRSWTLRLLGPASSADELAGGSEAVFNRAVTQVEAHGLEAGERYTLVLGAEDAGGIETTHQVSFLIPDPQYLLIPLEEGNLSRNQFAGFSVDGSGTLIAVGGNRSGEIHLIDRRAGTLRKLVLPSPIATEGQQLSKDGRRFFFKGVFRQPGGSIVGVGFVDLQTERLTGIAGETSLFFTADGTGRRVVFQSVLDLDPRVGNPNRMEQYFLYDDATKEIRQLTSDPHAIDREAVCPRLSGTTPVISANGSTIAFASSARLGVAPTDGCHLFAYDIATAMLRHVAVLPIDFDFPVISDDGRWLTFLLSRPVPPYILSQSFGALLDLETGALMEPVGGIVDFPTFDAVITGDGNSIVVSTQADLDPRVGNPDYNMELFVYDRATGEFTQISETTGGIGQFPGGCAPYRPRTSGRGDLAAFGFKLFSGGGGGCQLDGPQRNEADGFVFRVVRAVRRRAGNRPPTLQHVGDVRRLAGQIFTLKLSSVDPDGDPVTFFAQLVNGMDVPPGSDIEDHRNGKATFRWPTTREQVGLYALRVAAFDEGGGEVVQDVTLAVCSRIVADGSLPGVLTALFESEPPAPCRDADLNRDGVLSAADAVAAVVAAAA